MGYLTWYRLRPIIMSMDSKELVKRIIEHRNPPRIAFDVHGEYPRDILSLGPCKPVYRYPASHENWGETPELLTMVPGFRGDVRQDVYGNILGRLKQITKGECIKGVLQDGWDLLDSYEFPHFDMAYHQAMLDKNLQDVPKFTIAYLPTAIFSSIRDMRGMSNALMDTALYPEQVLLFMKKLGSHLSSAIELARQIGFDAVMFGDDLGMQDHMFFSPATFRELFKPTYADLIQKTHAGGMKFVMHSCGNIAPIIEDLIEIGLDVLQFDQPELYGSEYLAKEYGRRIAFYCPVDIQKILVTGDKDFITQSALHMVEAFEMYADHSFLFKDYPSWGDIAVEEEWADWAKQAVFGRYYVFSSLSPRFSGIRLSISKICPSQLRKEALSLPMYSR